MVANFGGMSWLQSTLGAGVGGEYGSPSTPVYGVSEKNRVYPHT